MRKTLLAIIIFTIILCCCSCSLIDLTHEPSTTELSTNTDSTAFEAETGNFSLDNIPPFTGTAYVEINNNIPFFTDTTTTKVFETYSSLDNLGRCGVAFANVCPELMPTEPRGYIGMIKPSGWHTIKYNGLIEGNYLYNRCHLIAYELTSENDNTLNLITGTRFLNIQGMLHFENMVADYVKSTGNHVLYRVTPIYDGDNLVASGVLMEGYSVEDKGTGICYCIYCYNAQPGIEIDYATGDSRLDDEATLNQETDYVVNTHTNKFHSPSCSSVDDIKTKNRKDYSGSREDLISQGYAPCKRCNP